MNRAQRRADSRRDNSADRSAVCKTDVETTGLPGRIHGLTDAGSDCHAESSSCCPAVASLVRYSNDAGVRPRRDHRMEAGAAVSPLRSDQNHQPRRRWPCGAL